MEWGSPELEASYGSQPGHSNLNEWKGINEMEVIKVEFMSPGN